VDYYSSMQQDLCPLCHSAADVRTVQDLVNMMSGQAPGNPMPGNPMPPAGPPGYVPNQPGGYQAEPFYGPETGYGYGGQGPRPRTDNDFADGGGYDLGQAVFNEAMGAVGRFIGKRMRRAMEERVVPAMNARAEQSRQEYQAIAQRYPELRACMKDQVIFLSGGTRTVPLSVAASNITLAQADAIVAGLRQP
jgi:hypothetical protein